MLSGSGFLHILKFRATRFLNQLLVLFLYRRWWILVAASLFNRVCHTVPLLILEPVFDVLLQFHEAFFLLPSMLVRAYVLNSWAFLYSLVKAKTEKKGKKESKLQSAAKPTSSFLKVTKFALMRA